MLPLKRDFLESLRVDPGRSFRFYHGALLGINDCFIAIPGGIFFNMQDVFMTDGNLVRQLNHRDESAGELASRSHLLIVCGLCLPMRNMFGWRILDETGKPRLEL